MTGVVPGLGAQTEKSPMEVQSKPDGQSTVDPQTSVQKLVSPWLAHLREAQSSLVEQAAPMGAATLQASQPAVTPR